MTNFEEEYDGTIILMCVTVISIWLKEIQFKQGGQYTCYVIKLKKVSSIRKMYANFEEYDI